MFTGIVEGLATIAKLDATEKGAALLLDVGELASGVRIGDSVALDGCCLTVTVCAPGQLGFQAVAETLALSSLGKKRVGDRLNVERALPAEGRLDGHIVQGHVDGTGTVRSLDRDADDVRLVIGCGEAVGDLLVPKGSIAIDGVSLTVVEPTRTQFSVALIPHTLEVTTLGERVPGDAVNLEADVLGKYVRHYLQRMDPSFR